jgi:hypothetical protein
MIESLSKVKCYLCDRKKGPLAELSQGQALLIGHLIARRRQWRDEQIAEGMKLSESVSSKVETKPQGGRYSWGSHRRGRSRGAGRASVAVAAGSIARGGWCFFAGLFSIPFGSIQMFKSDRLPPIVHTSPF